MLAAPVLPMPDGTPPLNHHRYYQQDDATIDTTITTASTSQSSDLFLYKAREVKSAPTPPKRTLEEFGESDSDDDSSLSSSSSSSYSSSPSVVNNSSSTTKIHKIKKSNKADRKKCCSCLCNWSCSSVTSFFVGHAPVFTAWSTSYASTSRLKYLSLFFLESSLRSIGDVTFCSNPFSGLLIFVGMLIACPLVAFLAFVTLTVGIETAVVFLHIPMEDVRSGVVTFNNYLTGTVVALVAQQDVILVKPDIIAVCIAIGILTVVIWKGLNGVVAGKYEFPMMNAPFHIIIILYIYSGMASRFDPVVGKDVREGPGVKPEDIAFNNATSQMYHHLGDVASTQMPSHFTPLDIEEGQTFVEPLNWKRLFFGVLLAPGPVFGTASLLTSGMVHLGVLIYSPIMLLQSLTGAAIGTLMGACLTNPEDYEILYNGCWGYNPLFTTAAIGGFFVVFNAYSWLLSIVGAILTTLLYATMVKCHLPAFGIPFMTITWLLIPGIPPPSSPTENDKSNAVVVQIDDDTGKMKQAFDHDDATNEGNDEKIKVEENTNGPFIRLHLGDITTPEEHRQKFLPKKFRPPRKNKKSGKSRNSGKRNAKEKFGGGGKENGSSMSKGNGTMNKYRSSLATPPEDQVPPELSIGVGQNSILPL